MSTLRWKCTVQRVVHCLREALNAACDLKVAVVTDIYRDQHRRALVGPSPAFLEVGTVHVDVGVPRTGQQPRLRRTPSGSVSRLYPWKRGTSRISLESSMRLLAHADKAHLRHVLLTRALSPKEALDELSRQGRTPELRHGELQITRRSRRAYASSDRSCMLCIRRFSRFTPFSRAG